MNVRILPAFRMHKRVIYHLFVMPTGFTFTRYCIEVDSPPLQGVDEKLSMEIYLFVTFKFLLKMVSLVYNVLISERISECEVCVSTVSRIKSRDLLKCMGEGNRKSIF